ncbi:unnamed protein product [Haemonchus placei]|uniref:Recep_L_domain domain-containing protein n=1 Tax=Haemonchus placei TaxID=6290 RepID=A0A0N4X315_HAEPC|nr:unnamed protein product [Haemonchus placei]
MKMALKRTDCSALVGDLLYPANDEGIEVWKRIHKVYGTVTVNGIEAMSLSILRNLVIDGWQQRVVRIINNRELRHIAEILTMTVTGPEPHFWFHNNTSFCHPVNIRKKIEAKLGSKISWDERCLTRCPGGSLNAKYLDDLDENCNVVSGDLVIEGLKDMPPHSDKLAQIEKISGRLVVKENSAVSDLSFLPYLKEIGSPGKKGPSLEVVDNMKFAMKGLDTLEKINGDVRVISEKETDVSNAVRKKIIGVTSGTASFFGRNLKS